MAYNTWGTSWGTSWNLAWTRSADVVAVVAGKIKKRAKALTKQRLRADLLAEKYNAIREQEAAKEIIAPIIKKFAKSEVLANLPPTPQVDFKALARDKAAREAFLKAIGLIKQIADEEDEIFSFMMAIA